MGQLRAARVVAATDHNHDLDISIGHFLDFRANPLGSLGVEPAVILAL